MKSFRRSAKAISPIFATLILIAIAVIAGVVVYMFVSGTLSTMTGGNIAGQEKVTIQAVQVNTGNALTVYAQAQGNQVTISNAIIKNAGGNVVGTVAVAILPARADTTANNLALLTLSPVQIPATGITYASGTATYTVTLVGAGGGSFVSPTFTITGP